MNEVYVEKLVSLVKQDIIGINEIKNAEYKTEVEKRLAN